MNHCRTGLVCSLDRIRDLIRCFGYNAAGFLALDPSIASRANYERRHPGAYSLHELMTIGVVKPGLSQRLRAFCSRHWLLFLWTAGINFPESGLAFGLPTKAQGTASCV
jgi:hypothetical protein